MMKHTEFEISFENNRLRNHTALMNSLGEALRHNLKQREAGGPTPPIGTVEQWQVLLGEFNGRAVTRDGELLDSVTVLKLGHDGCRFEFDSEQDAKRFCQRYADQNDQNHLTSK